MILALSIRQPWAGRIVSGRKDVENRTWTTTYRGPVLIHAGKQPDREEDGPYGELGGIVGVAELVDVVTESASPWFSGPFGFVLRNARPLPFTPCRGALGFFLPRGLDGAPLLQHLQEDRT